MRSRIVRLLSAGAGLLSLHACLASLARADEESDKVLATDLFDKGNAKMEEGSCDQDPIGDATVCKEARDLFRRSYEIYPAGLGALRNLAYVERGLGLFASAARRFRELERKAPADPNPKRHVWADFAKKELATLEPLVPHLTIVPPNPQPAGLVVTLDGAVLPRAAWATSIDVDPGSHRVHAEATGRTAFDSNVSVAEKDDAHVDITFAEDSTKPVIVSDTKSIVTPSRFGPYAGPIALTGAGTVAVLVGIGFGVSAISKRNDACGDAHYCEPNKLEEARSAARTSDIVTGLGLAAVAGGVLWYFLLPKTQDAPKSSPPTLVPWGSAGGAGAIATVRF